MNTIEMAKIAFASRRAVDAWFEDAAPNFELFSEMIRKDERENCAKLCDEISADPDHLHPSDCADAIRNV